MDDDWVDPHFSNLEKWWSPKIFDQNLWVFEHMGRYTQRHKKSLHLQRKCGHDNETKKDLGQNLPLDLLPLDLLVVQLAIANKKQWV